MDIKGFIDDSYVDWDGKIVSIIFLPTCNFRCPFCHSVNLVLHPEQIESIPLDYVTGQLEKHREWIDGVCITGGEPTLHTDLPELCAQLKSMRFSVKLDTNGTNPSMVRRLLEHKLVDYVAMDVKAPLTVEKYSQAAGVNAEGLLEKVKQSIELLMNSTVDYEFRTTVVPSIHSSEDIKQICCSLVGCKKYVLQKFDVVIGRVFLDPALPTKTFSDEEMQQFLVLAQNYIPNAKLRMR